MDITNVNVSGLAAATSVAAPSQRFRLLQVNANLIDSLYAGSAAMRNAGKLYLPQEPAETDQMYIIRLNRTTLFNGLKRTIQQAVGKVFSEPVELSSTADADIVLWSDDVDMQGRDLTHFAQETLNLAMRHGISYILVDYPHVGTEALTLDEFRSLGARPYLNNISLNQVLEIRSERIRGVERCTLFRMTERFEEFDPNPNNFTATEIQQVKVFRLQASDTNDEANVVTFEIWRQNTNSGNWEIYQQPTEIVGMTFIPIVPVYANRTGFMIGTPPLQDLAEKNLEHWRISSDHAHILHFCAVPVYFGKLIDGGLTDTGTAKPIVIAPNSLIIGSAPESDLKIIEHSGKAVEAQADQLKRIEDHMTILGLELYVNRPGTVTATQRAIDSAEQNSILKSMVFNLQDALEQAIGLVCTYMDLPEDSFGEVEVNTEFASVFRDANDVAYLFNLYDRGLLTAEQLIVEMQRRNVICADYELVGAPVPSGQVSEVTGATATDVADTDVADAGDDAKSGN